MTTWVIDWVNDWITARMSVYRFGPTGVHSIAFWTLLCWPCARNQNRKGSQKKNQNPGETVCCSAIVASFVQFYCRQHTLRMRNMVCISSLNCGQLVGSSVTETNTTNASFGYSHSLNCIDCVCVVNILTEGLLKWESLFHNSILSTMNSV